ncbi:succinate dehydrogenase, hydrophobic membrane anchor protein [Brackiella oedipodis]|uniref:succinate dehydrogenase, hydrophobic membrane anchor protein n=1 Tax=Brackiella oedipodis TaxID=124225 RepID=UPI00048E123A|nr:succinate dehydrogenase, hydrophobic membrane anchor protein [Brackiella oedipodis]
MENKEQFGTKRMVVGANYGTIDFIMQRLTAVIMAVYSLIFLIVALFTVHDYYSWVAMFTFTVGGYPLGQIAASLVFFSLGYHAWIGVRDVWMDYVPAAMTRLFMQLITGTWLLVAVIYFIKIVWSI